MSNKNINELLVVIEDSEEDFFAIQRAFNGKGKKIPIIHYSSAEKALLDLNEMQGIDLESNVVFLIDVGLPGLSGHEFLQKIKKMKNFTHSPTIMFSSSASTDDINRAYDYGASSFIKKHITFSEFVRIIENIKQYWFEINLLPVKSFSDFKRYNSEA